ncbi:MAG: DUF5652 family protein [Patescibacteria group bacterium]
MLNTFFENNTFLILVLIVLWTLPWKGIALWHAARRKERNWFIALLIINTFALLEIFYLAFWIKRHPKQEN